MPRRIYRASLISGLSLMLTLAGCSPGQNQAPHGDPLRGEKMTYQKMSDINSGYQSTAADWASFLTCWREGVTKRLGNDAGKYLALNGPSHLATVGDAAYERNRAQLDELEKSLGRKLPKSYRDFALVTGGHWWVESVGLEAPPGYASDFAPIKAIGKLRDVDPFHAGIWSKAVDGVAEVKLPPAVYYRYGYSANVHEQQDSAAIPYKEIGDLIKVGELEQGTILLLNPKEVTSDGEWEAWMLSPQIGAERYRSFAELMQLIAYQDILEQGGTEVPAEKLRATCARYLKTAATN